MLIFIHDAFVLKPFVLNVTLKFFIYFLRILNYIVCQIFLTF